MKNLIETLRNQAVEIAKEGHSGWGNTMSCAADAIEKLDAEGARGRRAIESIKKISKEYNSFLIFNPSSEYELLKSRRDFFWELEKIITDFQQSCKETTDEN